MIAQTLMKGQRSGFEPLQPAFVGDGDGARAVKLIANYYTLHLKSDWKMMQYHVDFHPPIDSRGLRKGLLSEHKAKFSVFLFDGMQLYTLTRFAEEVGLTLPALLSCIIRLAAAEPPGLVQLFVLIVALPHIVVHLV